MNKPLLIVENINKSYEKVNAVSEVSFEVFEGEILGLLGPNGAGKTTVIRMVMGIFEPDSGIIEFDEELVVDKKRVGYLPEERGIYDNTKVLDTILYFADLKDMDKDIAKKAAMKWLKRLDLDDFAHSKIEELSKGMQQKVQFIISIIHKPRLLVLDEVFSGLDPVNQDLFKNIIKDLASENTTILLSSHRMDLVEELCDRIFMIDHGKRVLYGEIDKIKNNFGEKKVKINATGNLNKLKILSNISNLSIDDNLASFSIKNDLEPLKLFKDIPDEINIKEISIESPSLHEIFVNEVKRRND